MSEHRFMPAFVEDVVQRTSLVKLIGRSLPLKQRGAEYWACCPFHAERTPSFHVVERKGFYKCFGCGASGDALGWMTAFHRRSFIEAVEELAEDAGLEVPGREGRQMRERKPLREPVRPNLAALALEEAEERARKTAWAAGVFAGCRDVDRGVVRRYLMGRGIDPARLPGGDLPVTLRASASLASRDDRGVTFWPAMVAAVQDGTGAVGGVHRTYLAERAVGEVSERVAGALRRLSGDDVSTAVIKAPLISAKKMGGVCWGGSCRLGPPGRRLYVAEGIETALSVMVATGEVAWAALSLGNMAGGWRGQGRRHPDKPGVFLPSADPDPTRPGLALPTDIREVVLCADGDNKDPHTSEALLRLAARRLVVEGRAVRIARPAAGKDFNDMLMEGAA